MEEYKSNSHKSRQNQNDDIPEKRVEKVVSGSVKSKKKNGLQKITNVFVPEDVDDVKSYIFEDIVVPAVKDIILDAVRAFLGVSGNSCKKFSSSQKCAFTDKEFRTLRSATKGSAFGNRELFVKSSTKNFCFSLSNRLCDVGELCPASSWLY